MSETKKAHGRRLRAGFYDKYLQGNGIDIGCGDDPIVPWCDTFEKAAPDNGRPITSGTQYTGDATTMPGVQPLSYDWVYTSHIIEHVDFPHIAIASWFKLLKPGGYLIIYGPHRDLYERRRTLPSNWNSDHRTFWTLDYDEPPCTYGIIPTIRQTISPHRGDLIYALRCDDDWGFVPEEQHAGGEYSFEIVIRKRTEEEILQQTAHYPA